MANLEKEAKAAGCWKEAHSGAQAAMTLAMGGGVIDRESKGHLIHSMANRDTSVASTASKVIGLPGISGPLHMLLPLPGTPSTLQFAW